MSWEDPAGPIVPGKRVEAVELLFHNVYRLFYAKIPGKHMAAVQACVATSVRCHVFDFAALFLSIVTLPILEDHLETSFT